MPEQDYVYAIGHPHGYAKIGESNNPTDRLKDLQSATPYELWLITVVESTGEEDGRNRSLERLLHEYYKAVCVKREWFDLPEDEIEALGRLQEIDKRLLGYVLDDLRQAVYTDDPVDEFVQLGEEGKTLEDWLSTASDEVVVTS